MVYAKMWTMDAPEDILNNRYKLLERAGSGGMATVYKAQDLVLHRFVAIKILHHSLTHDQDFLTLFQREARAAAHLAHPNIVTVHDIGQDGFRHYIVMEYVPGRTLKQLIRQNEGPLSLDLTLELSIQIAAGLGYAHRAGFVHCDVKPQNVLVTPDRQIKIADFGIARAMSHASQHNPSLVWGTPHYAAPEQAGGDSPTPASDVYAIGVILFEMLSGELPFQADTLPGIVLKHMNEPAPLVTVLNPAVPPQLEQIIYKVMSKEPAGRYREAGQLERILQSYQKNSLQMTGVVPAPIEPTPEPIRLDESKPYQRPVLSQPNPVVPAPIRSLRPRPDRPVEDLHVPIPLPPAQPDWVAVILACIAVTAMLGLIPLWYLAWQAWVG